MAQPVTSKVIVKHLKDCWALKKRMKRKWGTEWSGVIVDSYFGNYAGNKGKQGSRYYYHAISCNNPNCPAIKIVSAKAIASL